MTLLPFFSLQSKDIEELKVIDLAFVGPFRIGLEIYYSKIK